MAPVAALYLCHIMFINLVQLTNPFFIPAFFSASVHFLPIQTNIPLLPQSRIKQSYNDINWLINESGYFFVGIGLLSTRNQSIRTSKPHTFETTLQSGFFFLNRWVWWIRVDVWNQICFWSQLRQKLGSSLKWKLKLADNALLFWQVEKCSLKAL